jgi:hypothetical protein
VGIIGSTAASFAQSKGIEEIVAGIGGSGIGRGKEIGKGDLKDLEMVGAGGLVCVDIDTEADGGMIGEYV